LTDGRLAGLQGVLTDVTERKRVEEEIKTSEQKYRLLADNATDVVWILDLKTQRFTYFSPSVQKLLGYTPEEAMAMPLDKLLTPDSYRKSVQDHRDTVIRISRPGADPNPTRLVQFEEICKDGSIIFTEARLKFLLDEQGKPVATIGAKRDITGRKRAEEALRASQEKYRELVENLNDVIFVADEQSVLTYISPVVGRFGYASAEMVGRPFSDFVHPDDLPQLRKRLIETLSGDLPAGDYRVITKGGEIRWVSVSSRPIFTDGRLAGIQGVLTDVTDRRSLQEQINRAQKLAAMGELLSGVAHEINNPLTGVIGFTELLAAEASGLDEEHRKEVKMIHAEALRIKKIMKGLLSFGRKQTLEKGNVLIRDIMEQVLGISDSPLRASNILVETDFPGERMPVLANISQLMQVFLNLITNAQQALQERADRKGEIRISVSRHGGTVLTKITDNGPGIPPENLPKIFDPFFTTKPEGKGTGLGLAVSYGLVKEHGGDIRVESEPGKTTFTVILPEGEGYGGEGKQDSEVSSQKSEENVSNGQAEGQITNQELPNEKT